MLLHGDWTLSPNLWVLYLFSHGCRFECQHCQQWKMGEGGKSPGYGLSSKLMHLYTDQTGSRGKGDLSDALDRKGSHNTNYKAALTKTITFLWMKPFAWHTHFTKAVGGGHSALQYTYITHQTLKDHKFCFQSLNLFIQLLLESFRFLRLLQEKAHKELRGHRATHASSLNLRRTDKACHPPHLTRSEKSAPSCFSFQTLTLFSSIQQGTQLLWLEEGLLTKRQLLFQWLMAWCGEILHHSIATTSNLPPARFPP